jgi:hypothetical protein
LFSYLPMYDPVMHTCGNTYCRACLLSIPNKKCPHCNKDIRADDLLPSALIIKNLLSEVRVICEDCKTEMKREQLEFHQAKSCIARKEKPKEKEKAKEKDMTDIKAVIPMVVPAAAEEAAVPVHAAIPINLYVRLVSRERVGYLVPIENVFGSELVKCCLENCRLEDEIQVVNGVSQIEIPVPGVSTQQLSLIVGYMVGGLRHIAPDMTDLGWYDLLRTSNYMDMRTLSLTCCKKIHEYGKFFFCLCVLMCD